MTTRTPSEDQSGTAGGPPVTDPFYFEQAPYLKPINVPGAWELLTSTRVKRKRVTVAHIDTGVKIPVHPDLRTNLVTGYNVIDHSTNTADKVGHGTRMAGILGATINNSVGIAGVMDLVNIMPISLEDQYEARRQSEAIDYIIRNKESKNIKVILMPISFSITTQELANKVNEAAQAGILMVFTAGNQGRNITEAGMYPCSYTQSVEGILCVAATGRSNMNLIRDSNFADYVDIAAPGTDIATTGFLRPYEASEGTSPASAIIAGVAAMLYSLAPDLTPVDVKKIIKDTSKKGVKNAQGKPVRFGRVDAAKAVAKLIPKRARAVAH
ncbi:hypothetical protein FOL47_000437 [Perkinsus chesapeaki]|uniref:subtilisin n=1 Tax=Perkinsus chesapeaki TaxID=330153 RepID=A0A7J6MLS7_PERCH|nr:hypothetical protein FOL47_000437 [Perkinsus chesapeaki]